ncbi:class I adenylate-forming enzyme family protein [Sinimarinibacterium thermocellulolyticum]|uniref:AMP-binding protein n=1 Tax=Sinimarinibacterium thermocellulolyticum TaxID=3170016 RepID=A0ABV2AEU0_9GAMM
MAQTLSSALSWWAKETPDSRALVIGDDFVSYSELDAWASQVAVSLIERGVRHGDRVGTIGGTTLAHCALMLGTIRAGAIVSPLSTRLTPREVIEFYERTCPKCVFVDPDQAERHAQIEEVAGPRIAMETILALRGRRAVEQTWDCAPDDAVGIIATSGSTARPKGVVLTHRSMLSYAMEFAIEEPFSGPGSRALALSPLSTSAGFVQLMEFIALGATLRFESVFDPQRALKLLVSERINMFQGVPLFFERIAACPDFEHADLSALTYTSVGGAPVPRKLLDVWMKKGCLLRQIYGQTEAGGAISIMTKADAAKYPEKAGRGGMFTEIRIIDDNGKFLGPNQPGQIVIRGPSVMQGYWGDPENTAKTLVDGWLRTGDLGSIDEHGYLTFIDRLKDIIISGGLNISAAEVERVVAEFPGVHEVAVIGAKDEKFGETPLAVVHAELSLDIPALIDHCNRYLADYKVPRYVEIEAEPLPRLATGKLAKPAIREKYLPKLASLKRVR